MPDLPATIPNAESLAPVNALALEMASFCELKIAEGEYLVQPPPKIWLGREFVCLECFRKFEDNGCTLATASLAVDHAVLNLWSAKENDPRHFLKQTLLIRLKQLKQLTLDYIKYGRTETTYKFVPLYEIPEEHWSPEQRDKAAQYGRGVLVKQQDKEKRTVGVDLGAIMQLQNLEKMMAELCGLYDTDDGGAEARAMELFDKIDSIAIREKQKADESKSSRALAAKNKTLATMTSPADKALMADILIGSPQTVQAVVVMGKKKAGRPKKVVKVEAEMIEDENYD